MGNRKPGPLPGGSPGPGAHRYERVGTHVDTDSYGKHGDDVELAVSPVKPAQTQSALQLALKVSAWVSVFYGASVWAGILNKDLIHKHKVSAMKLSLLHLLMAVAIDYVILRSTEWRTSSKVTPTANAAAAAGNGNAKRHNLSFLLRAFTPIALAMVASKVATYMSYSYVDLSLTHTVKASEPIFNAICAAVFFQQLYSWQVYASLAPIATGVTMASLSSISYNHIGFLAAMLSALMKVLQNIFTKRLMNEAKFSFFELHMFSAVAAVVVMVPSLVISTFGTDSAPLLDLFLSSFVQYMCTLSSYMVLSLVTHLSFAIANCLKRAILIVAAVWYYGQPWSGLNTLGVAIAIAGIFCYNTARQFFHRPTPTEAAGPKATRQRTASDDDVADEGV